MRKSLDIDNHNQTPGATRSVAAQGFEKKNDPDPLCDNCPRLSAFLAKLRPENPGWFNAPVPTFGDKQAKLLIIGLAPGLRGANRTGRPFTGDYAGDLLYKTLAKFYLSNDGYAGNSGDGLTLRGVAITNAVRCVPPQNKPTSLEIANCRPFLDATLATYRQLEGCLVLGRVAHDTLLRTLSLPSRHHPFSHGAVHEIDSGPLIFDSYHCSRYNTNTRRLTPAMFEAVFEVITKRIAF